MRHVGADHGPHKRSWLSTAHNFHSFSFSLDLLSHSFDDLCCSPMPMEQPTSSSNKTQDDLNTDYVNERSVSVSWRCVVYYFSLNVTICSHIEAFAHALTAEYFVDNDYLDSPRRSPSTLSIASGQHYQANSPIQDSRFLQAQANGSRTPRIRKVSALSDFAPVNLRVRKRRKGPKHHERRQEWLFVLVRWPLLVCTILLGSSYTVNLITKHRYLYSSLFSLSSDCMWQYGSM